MPSLNRAQERVYLRDYGEFQFAGGDERLLIELHWRITESYFSLPPASAQL